MHVPQTEGPLVGLEILRCYNFALRWVVLRSFTDPMCLGIAFQRQQPLPFTVTLPPQLHATSATEVPCIFLFQIGDCPICILVCAIKLPRIVGLSIAKTDAKMHVVPKFPQCIHVLLRAYMSESPPSTGTCLASLV